jgi:ABC-type transport system substrate-binding protein
MKTSGVDLIRNVSSDLVPELKANPLTYVSSTPILRVHYIELDIRQPPFDKKAVRQAANYAIDKQAIIQKLMGGLGQQVATVVQPLAFGFDAEVQPFPYDPKKAKELLAQAGYPNGVDITAHSAFVEFRPVFEAITQMLTDVGLAPTPGCGIQVRPGTSSSRPRARPPTPPTARGGTIRCSTPTRCCIRSSTPNRGAGSASTTRAWKASTS